MRYLRQTSTFTLPVSFALYVDDFFGFRSWLTNFVANSAYRAMLRALLNRDNSKRASTMSMRNGRNPRRLPPASAAPAESQSTPSNPVQLLPRTRPDMNSLFWRLWRRHDQVAKAALESDFVQGIGNGTLDPIVYGGFMVTDAWYCFQGPGIYSKVAERALDPTLQAFFKHKYQSYTEYNVTFSKRWHLRDASSVLPTDVLREYAAFEQQVAEDEAPIYTLVAMLPCEHLWAWLGTQLKPYDAGNLYAPWIEDNDEMDGAYQIGNYLEDYAARHPDVLVENKAMEIYGRAMTFEMRNFFTAIE